MPTILNTGAGLYQNVKDSNYDPIAAVKEAGAIEAQLVEAKYRVRKEREAQFLKTMDAETGKFMFGQLQTEAVKRLKKAQEDSAEIYRLSGENPTLEDNIKISNIMRDFEGWRDERLAFSKQYSEMAQLHNEDRGRTFDFDKSQEQLTYAANNPLTATMSPFPLRIKSVDEALNNYYQKVGADKYGDHNIRKVEDANGDIDVWDDAYRVGMETENDKKRLWDQALETELDIKRIGNDKWNSLNPDKQKKYIQNYGKENAWKGFMTEQYYDTGIFGKKQEKYIDKLGGTKKEPSSMTWNFNTNSNGKYALTADSGYKNKTTNETGSILIQPKSSSGNFKFSLSDRWTVSPGGKQVESALEVPTEGLRITDNYIIGQVYKTSKDINEELSAKLVNTDGTAMTEKQARRKETLYNELGYNVSLVKEGDKYKFANKSVVQEVYLDISNEQNKKDAYTQLMNGLNIKDKTYSQFVDYINSLKPNASSNVKPTPSSNEEYDFEKDKRK